MGLVLIFFKCFKFYNMGTKTIVVLVVIGVGVYLYMQSKKKSFSSKSMTGGNPYDKKSSGYAYTGNAKVFQKTSTSFH